MSSDGSRRRQLEDPRAESCEDNVVAGHPGGVEFVEVADDGRRGVPVFGSRLRVSDTDAKQEPIGMAALIPWGGLRRAG